MANQQPHQDHGHHHGHHHHGDHEHGREQGGCTATGTLEPGADACCDGETDSGCREAAPATQSTECAGDGCCE